MLKGLCIGGARMNVSFAQTDKSFLLFTIGGGGQSKAIGLKENDIMNYDARQSTSLGCV